MTFPHVQNSPLPPNTIVPQDKDLFIPYLNRLYEDIAYAVNNKDDVFFPFSISATPADIPNLPNFGSFIICVGGSDPVTNPLTTVVNWLPTITASLCKTQANVAGTIAVLGSQAGTGDIWLGVNLVITSTGTNFQIAHDDLLTPGLKGNFNIKFIGSQ